MARHVQPALADDDIKTKKRARVSKTPTNLTKTQIETVVEDDPTKRTNEGDARLFINQALRRFNRALDAEAYDRYEGLQDVLMVDGDGQWDDDIRGRRKRKKRPCLTINRMVPMIAHVANEQRMARPSIKIDPVGGGADPTDAEIRQGLIRHIEVMSSAETIYDTAFERMIEKGWSWFRVVTDWDSPTSFNQVIKIEGFQNDFSIYADPDAQEPTRKDQKWVFIVWDMPRGEYLEQHKDSIAASLTNFSSVGDEAAGWLTADSVRVAEYYYIDEQPVNAVRLIGGEGVYEDEIEERDGLWYRKDELEQFDSGAIPQEVVKPVPVELDENQQLIKRKSFRPIVKWAKFNACEILDGDQGDNIKANTAGRRIAGRYIPVIRVTGRERILKGQRRTSGMIRHNREAQRIYNYMASGFVEMVALAPKSPFIAAIGQIEDFKDIWKALNEENYPYLPYTPKDVGGQLVPPPMRQENKIAESVVGYLQGLNQFDNILKVGFNIFDPTLGAPHADQSGRAVASLQSRSDVANMNWMDNMRRAQIFCGEVILEMIPDIYDSARIVTIIRADKNEQVPINQEFADPKTKKVMNHDMAVGKYSVTVSIGEYASKRQEAVKSLTEVAKNVPQLALALMPLILSNMDTPMAKEAAEIVKRMQPANLQEPDSPEALQSKFQALMQQHQLLVTALNRANQALQTKELDNATKKYIAGLQAQAQIVAAAMKAGSADSIQQASQEFDRITQLLDHYSDVILAEKQQAHELTLQENEPAPAAAAQ